MQWVNANEPTDLNVNLTLTHVMVALVVTSFVYIFVTWYTNALHATTFGPGSPWHFPVTVRKINMHNTVLM